MFGRILGIFVHLITFYRELLVRPVNLRTKSSSDARDAARVHNDAADVGNIFGKLCNVPSRCNVASFGWQCRAGGNVGACQQFVLVFLLQFFLELLNLPFFF